MLVQYLLTKVGWHTDSSVNYGITGSDNSLSPVGREAIISIIVELLVIGPLGTNIRKTSLFLYIIDKFQWILIGIPSSLFRKMHLKMSSVKIKTILSRVDDSNIIKSCYPASSLTTEFILPFPKTKLPQQHINPKTTKNINTPNMF